MTMREIRFRGKCTPEFPHPTVKWVYGSLVSDSKKKKKTALICAHLPVPTRDGNTFWYEVYADTVGQFTGLLDCEGREIYEGDILGNKYPNYYKYKFANAVVEWGVDGWLADCFSLREWLKLHTCVVVGNIYENSELLPELSEVKDARD